jgi:hypothetical protein
MRDWPAAPEQIPAPRLVAAWARLNVVPSERLPLWAAHWLAARCQTAQIDLTRTTARFFEILYRLSYTARVKRG